MLSSTWGKTMTLSWFKKLTCNTSPTCSNWLVFPLQQRFEFFPSEAQWFNNYWLGCCSCYASWDCNCQFYCPTRRIEWPIHNLQQNWCHWVAIVTPPPLLSHHLFRLQKIAPNIDFVEYEFGLGIEFNQATVDVPLFYSNLSAIIPQYGRNWAPYLKWGENGVLKFNLFF